MRLFLTLASLLALTLPLAACGDDAAGTKAGAGPSDDRVAGVTYDEHGEPAGLHRFHKWSERVGQGAQPAGEAAWKNLKALGYTTILSVDGSVPDVEGAAAHGLRYVHVPIGYDGITKELGLKIVKAAHTSEGPIFVHCHHGKHRGPAAAMVARIAEDGISNEEAVKGLEASGTSPNYTGLWRDVKAFVAPTEEELATVGELPSKVLPAGLRAGMVDVNVRFELLTESKNEGWQVPKAHPDVSPQHEARMLWELYRELARNDTECREKGDVFLAHMKEGEAAATALEEALRAGDTAAADKHYGVIKNNCSTCHKEFRN